MSMEADPAAVQQALNELENGRAYGQTDAIEAAQQRLAALGFGEDGKKVRGRRAEPVVAAGSDQDSVPPVTPVTEDPDKAAAARQAAAGGDPGAQTATPASRSTPAQAKSKTSK